jgi:murein L,D-transpeptidase YafK
MSGVTAVRLIAVLATLALGAAGLTWLYRPAAPLPRGTRADLLVVHKSTRRMLVYAHGSLLRSYVISLGHEPVGPKRREGDHRTPEGRYVIDQHNPYSAFHRSLHVSYPSAADAARARAAGHPPGGEIMIHGTRNGGGWLGRLHLVPDWTDGCIAVSDSEIDELYRIVPDGTPIVIRP